MELSKKSHFIWIYAALISWASLGAITSCTSTESNPESNIEAIEDEKFPLKDSECLEGEYLDKGTDSCEQLENQTGPEGTIDVPPEAEETEQ